MKSRSATPPAAARDRVRKAKRQWEVRREVAEPRSSFEELELRTADGAALRALVDDPPEAQAIRGTLVLAHAMFAQKSAFGLRDAPGLSSALAANGFRTIAFDFRGHGHSTPREWAYDDLVRRDLPAVVEYARTRGDGKPLVVLGHALGGQVALAAQGTGRIDVDAVVTLAANVWLRELEASRLRWGAKKAIAHLMLAAASRAGSIAALVRSVPPLERPLQRLGVDIDDTSNRHVNEVFRAVTEGRWHSADGRDDYLDALARVRVPLAAVLGDRDLLTCHPSAGEAFARRCGGAVAFFHAPVGHRDVVASPLAWPYTLEAVEWAVAQARP